jgi:hypothetical protein
MGLKIIGAGFGRTGTASLKVALEMLGFGPCHHMFEVLRDPQQIEAWSRVVHQGDRHWDAIFTRFQSACDWPSAAYYRDLMAAYPEAKVILTVRDAEGWYDSVRETIYRFQQIFPRWLSLFLPWNRKMSAMLDVVWDGVFGGRFEDRAHAIATFNANTAEVIRLVPPSRLLVFNVAEGWEPLCRFLGVPVPAAPFPRVNDRLEMKRRLMIFSALRYVPHALATVVLAGLAYWLWG